MSIIARAHVISVAASAIYEFSQRVAVESHSQGVGALQQQVRPGMLIGQNSER